MKKILWIHAASIGEFKSSDLIIERYHKVFDILVTTTTKSSAEYIRSFIKIKLSISTSHLMCLCGVQDF